MMSRKNEKRFRTSEVIAYLEERIMDDLATLEEEELYQDYQWYGYIDESCDTYRLVVRKMNRLWNNGNW